MKPAAAEASSKTGVEDPTEREARPDAPEAEDRVLAARAGSGDAAAFRTLVLRHRDRAYGLAARIVRSSSDAEEVAQDAFVRAWKALPAFRGEALFSTWLHRIVARAALDRVRTLGARRRRETALDEPESVPAHDHSAGREVEPELQRLKLERLVADLPEIQRAAVTLYYYEDRSVDRVAAALDLPVGTVKTHLSRARAALRLRWTREEGRRSP